MKVYYKYYDPTTLLQQISAVKANRPYMTIWQRRFVPKVDEATRSLERDGRRVARRGMAGHSGAGRDASVSDLHSLFAECGIRASTSVYHNYDFPPKMIDIERLIELVKQNEFLYDINHKDYKNPSLKTVTWELIAKELNGTSKCAFYVQKNNDIVYLYPILPRMPFD